MKVLKPYTDMRYRWLGAGVAAMLVLAVTPPAATASQPLELAARPFDDAKDDKGDEKDSPNARWRSAKSIEKIQKSLADMGLYLGPIDGHLSEETRAAIRVYQKGAGLKVDGKVSRELWDLLNNTVKVRELLLRLEKARKTSRAKAREALLSHPATRDLVDASGDERADPTRDSDACFAEPTVRCLLAEATESSKAVFRQQLRDWALGEILVAEARAGLTENAMQTVRRIRDPRLIMVALRDIAEAEAASGSAAEALAAAEIIPNLEKQAEALAAIAEIQLRRNTPKAARTTANHLLTTLERLKDPLKRVALRTRAAVIIAKSGDSNAANRQMTVAEYTARDNLDGMIQGTALRYVASALAKMARPNDAMEILDDITSPSERTSVLVSAAEAQVQAGDAAAALATAETIEKVRFKAAVLGHIAQTQAERGQRDAAETTIDLAFAAIEKIKSPYARSFATTRIALAMASLTDVGGQNGESKEPFTYAKAAETAARIDDSRLRAQTLWSIASARRAAGDEAGAKETEVQAESATNSIVSRLSRVWMFSEIALSHARRGQRDTAEAALRRGLDIAKGLENNWARSRALARLATTVVEVVDPQPALLLTDPN